MDSSNIKNDNKDSEDTKDTNEDFKDINNDAKDNKEDDKSGADSDTKTNKSSDNDKQEKPKSERQETTTKQTIDLTKEDVKNGDSLGPKPFQRIAFLVINLTLIATVITFALILLSLSVATLQWILRLPNYLTATYNWLSCVHSVVALRCYLGLRWDVYYFIEQKQEKSNLTFNFNAFAALLVFELMLISRIILVYIPLMS